MHEALPVSRPIPARLPEAGVPPPTQDPIVDAVLRRIEGGDAGARAELIELLYADLHGRAARMMRRQRFDHTLQATALLNEACMRLLGDRAAWNDRAHFLCAAATAMRSVLVDHARSRARQKRTAPGERLQLDLLLLEYEQKGVDVEGLDHAIGRLAKFDPAMARACELRYFACLDAAETARVLGLSKRTFERHWSAARAWLRGAMR